MGTLFETQTLLSKSRNFIVDTELSLQEYTADLVSKLPEINDRKIKFVKRKNLVKYTDTDKVIKVNGQRLTLDQLEVTEIMPGKVSVAVTYSTPIFRPFLFLGTCLGMLCGLLPGVIVYFLFREPADEEVKKVMPALTRFEAIAVHQQ